MRGGSGGANRDIFPLAATVAAAIATTTKPATGTAAFITLATVFNSTCLSFFATTSTAAVLAAQ